MKNGKTTRRICGVKDWDKSGRYTLLPCAQVANWRVEAEGNVNEVCERHIADHLYFDGTQNIVTFIEDGEG